MALRWCVYVCVFTPPGDVLIWGECTREVGREGGRDRYSGAGCDVVVELTSHGELYLAQDTNTHIQTLSLLCTLMSSKNCNKN